ncbi:hypothetical protein EV714DRAFT_277032 [Schizophyllum commune]
MWHWWSAFKRRKSALKAAKRKSKDNIPRQAKPETDASAIERSDHVKPNSSQPAVKVPASPEPSIEIRVEADDDVKPRNSPAVENEAIGGPSFPIRGGDTLQDASFGQSLQTAAQLGADTVDLGADFADHLTAEGAPPGPDNEAPEDAAGAAAVTAAPAVCSFIEQCEQVVSVLELLATIHPCIQVGVAAFTLLYKVYSKRAKNNDKVDAIIMQAYELMSVVAK